ncbi:MAG TPA: hypothetical protein VFT49_00995 [Candidatus Saccharimonadales bacterium]|nr:hypothetical protein [Candidatus Saccharimonadales bacterium]
MAKHRARRSSPLYLPSAFELFTPSKDLFIKYFNVFGILYILPLLFWLHSWVDTPAHGHHYWTRTSDANYGWTLPGGYNAAFIGFSILWFLIAIIGGTIVQIMTQRAQLDAAEDKEPTLDRAWQTVKEMWPNMVKLFIAMIIIIGIGFVLLIIPGLFMIKRYMFAPYVMLDKKCGVKEALEGSHELSNKNTGAVWGVIGVMFLLSIVGIVPIIGSLASFILGALYSIAPAIRYQQLKKLP